VAQHGQQGHFRSAGTKWQKKFFEEKLLSMASRDISISRSRAICKNSNVRNYENQKQLINIQTVIGCGVGSPKTALLFHSMR
jgi:hypothetical protein